MPRQTTNHASTERGYRKQFLLTLAVLVVLLIALKINGDEVVPANPQKSVNSVSSFDKKAYSLTDPTSIWVIVNKQHPLTPITYEPALAKPTVTLKPGRSASELQIAPITAIPLQRMFDAAAKAGHHLRLTSAYRSYKYQVRVYDSIVASAGQLSADEQSARPGYSEHQTGLATDVAPLSGKCELSECFADTAEGQWLTANAYKYGFIVRYAPGKQAITGYEHEPWHIRYVGSMLSRQMHDQNVTTMEEFFNVSGGGAYK